MSRTYKDTPYWVLEHRYGHAKHDHSRGECDYDNYTSNWQRNNRYSSNLPRVFREHRASGNCNKVVPMTRECQHGTSGRRLPEYRLHWWTREPIAYTPPCSMTPEKMGLEPLSFQEIERRAYAVNRVWFTHTVHFTQFDRSRECECDNYVVTRVQYPNCSNWLDVDTDMKHGITGWAYHGWDTYEERAQQVAERHQTKIRLHRYTGSVDWEALEDFDN